MNSLKAVDKRIAKRRQVYKAILSNPFVNEEQIWPHVSNQQLVIELLQKYVLNRLQHLIEMKVDRTQWPFTIITDFNKIYKTISETDITSSYGNQMILFVCNKDPEVPLVMLQQIPLLTCMSQKDIILTQLPKGTLPLLQKYIDLPYGILLLPTNQLDPVFVNQIKEQVSNQNLKWLKPLKYKQTDIKLIKSSAPLMSKNKQNNTK